jgi:DNA invertase Pin-like site-specific DNA recombinase
MFTIIAATAEPERSVIRERVVARLEYARANGTKSGWPIGHPRVIFHHDQVAALRSVGLSWRQIAARHPASSTAVRRRALNTPPDASQPCQNPLSF